MGSGLTGYLFEKSCYPPEHLTGMAEELRFVSAVEARRDISRYLHVAIRHSLLTVCAVCHASFASDWVLGLLRQGRRFWEDKVKMTLLDALDDLSEEEDLEEEDEEPPADDDILPRATKTLAALLDLREAIRKHGAESVPGFRSKLGLAFNGITKVISTRLATTWETSWPADLEQKGRVALKGVLETWSAGPSDRVVSAEDLAPLDEADVVDLDPDRAPEVDREEEQRRRGEVTDEDYLSGDLVVPSRYAHAELERIAASECPEHQECVAYAREPRGSLVLRGTFRSGLHWIQWAIGRHWFVERLETVRALPWRDLVENNVLAQTRSHWTVPRLLLTELWPVYLDDGSFADPGFAGHLLAHRLKEGLVTVLASEFPLDLFNLPREALTGLQAARVIELPCLEDSDLSRLGMKL